MRTVDVGDDGLQLCKCWDYDGCEVGYGRDVGSLILRGRAGKAAVKERGRQVG